MCCSISALCCVFNYVSNWQWRIWCRQNWEHQEGYSVFCSGGRQYWDSIFQPERKLNTLPWLFTNSRCKHSATNLPCGRLYKISLGNQLDWAMLYERTSTYLYRQQGRQEAGCKTSQNSYGAHLSVWVDITAAKCGRPLPIHGPFWGS